MASPTHTSPCLLPALLPLTYLLQLAGLRQPPRVNRLQKLRELDNPPNSSHEPEEPILQTGRTHLARLHAPLHPNLGCPVDRLRVAALLSGPDYQPRSRIPHLRAVKPQLLITLSATLHG